MIRGFSNSQQRLFKIWFSELTDAVMNFRKMVLLEKKGTPSFYDSAYKKFHEVLNQYHQKDPIILKEMLNQNIQGYLFFGEERPLLHLLTEIMAYAKDEEAFQAAKKIVTLFMEKGSNPYLQNRSPVLWVPAFGEVLYREKILQLFLPCDAPAENKEKILFSIFIQGILQSANWIFLILEMYPDFMNKEDPFGQRPLMLLLDNESPLALPLINHPKIDLGFETYGFTPLQVALLKNQRQEVIALLNKYCTICPLKNIQFPEDPEYVALLAQSGYYLMPGKDKNFPAFTAYIPDPEYQNEKIFFTLKGEDNEIAHISTPEEIEQTTIVPSQNQIRRLHASFIEILRLDQEAGPLYKAFSRKFPFTESIHVVSLGVSLLALQTVRKKYNPARIPGMFSSEIVEALTNPQADYDDLESSLKESFNLSQSYDHSLEELINIIRVFYKGSKEGFHTYIKKATPQVEKMFFKVHFLFLRNILKQFIERADNRQIDEALEYSAHLISAGCIYAINHSDNKKIELIEFLEWVQWQYQAKKVSPINIQPLVLFTDVIKMPFFIGWEFYDEILVILNKSIRTLESLGNHPDPMRHNFVNLSLKAIQKLTPSEHYLDKQFLILEKMNKAITQGHKQLHFTLNFKEFKEEYAKKSKLVLALYESLIQQFLPTCGPVFKLTLGDQAGQLRIEFIEGYNKKRLHSVLRPIDLLERGNNYFINCYGQSALEIQDILNKLSAIAVQDIKVEIKNTAASSASTSPLDQTSQEGSSCSVTYLPSLDLRTTSSVSSKKSMGSTKPKPQANQPILHADLSAELRINFNLNDNVEIFPLLHPGFPENKRHLCYGCWLPDQTDPSGFILSEDLMTRNKAILLNGGQFSAQAKNKTGLVQTLYYNEATGLHDHTLKIKIKSENLRIVAVPYHVRLDSGELAWVLCFGVPRVHEQKDHPSVDPAKFIKPYLKEKSPKNSIQI